MISIWLRIISGWDTTQRLLIWVSLIWSSDTSFGWSHILSWCSWWTCCCSSVCDSTSKSMLIWLTAFSLAMIVIKTSACTSHMNVRGIFYNTRLIIYTIVMSNLDIDLDRVYRIFRDLKTVFKNLEAIPYNIENLRQSNNLVYLFIHLLLFW